MNIVPLEVRAPVDEDEWDPCHFHCDKEPELALCGEDLSDATDWGDTTPADMPDCVLCEALWEVSRPICPRCGEDESC